MSRTFFFQSPGAHRALHSFPTRRSSDLFTWSRSSWSVTFAIFSRAPFGVPSPMVRHHATTRKKRNFEAFREKRRPRSEEHTSELQSRRDLVCRLLLEKKKNV